jgi:hypothetical protein
MVGDLACHSSKLPNEVSRLDADCGYEFENNRGLRHNFTEQQCLSWYRTDVEWPLIPKLLERHPAHKNRRSGHSDQFADGVPNALPNKVEIGCSARPALRIWIPQLHSPLNNQQRNERLSLIPFVAIVRPASKVVKASRKDRLNA